MRFSQYGYCIAQLVDRHRRGKTSVRCRPLHRRADIRTDRPLGRAIGRGASPPSLLPAACEPSCGLERSSGLHLVPPRPRGPIRKEPRPCSSSITPPVPAVIPLSPSLGAPRPSPSPISRTASGWFREPRASPIEAIRVTPCSERSRHPSAARSSISAPGRTGRDAARRPILPAVPSPPRPPPTEHPACRGRSPPPCSTARKRCLDRRFAAMFDPRTFVAGTSIDS